ncbi:MAG: S-layer homology domain-containing protein, partial [Oscillospiraceae bacterium]|nr:S-layer homology domain-containing protein [Oscillospiraceae bacterium]
MDNVPNQVNDWSSVPLNRTVTIKTCYATGVITGMSDGSFHGEQFMTRAQPCLVITRITVLIGSEPPAASPQP